MPSKYRFYYLIGLSSFIHALILAFLPGPSFQKLLGAETFQIISVVSDEDLPATTFHSSDLKEQIDWLEALEQVDREDDQPASQQDTFVQQFILPSTHFNKFEEAYSRNMADPVLTASLSLTPDRVELLPSAMAELPIELDWHKTLDRTLQSTPDDKSDQKIVSTLNDTTEEKPPHHNEIEGPVASRQIMFQPELPIVSLEKNTIITMKFWVFPDGTVGKIIPLKKADAELERIAINYLKQWRFSVLPRESSQDEQWGIIPIKFKIN